MPGMDWAGSGIGVGWTGLWAVFGLAVAADGRFAFAGAEGAGRA